MEPLTLNESNRNCGQMLPATEEQAAARAAWLGGTSRRWSAECYRNVSPRHTYFSFRSVVAEGRTYGEAAERSRTARKAILVAGWKQFGAPTAVLVRRLWSLSDPELLDLLLARLRAAAGWEELLAPGLD